MKKAAVNNKTNADNKSKPFFNKNGEGTFFAANKEENGSFFQPQLIQTALTVGAPNDPFEQEADKVGRQVMNNFGQASGIQAKLADFGIQTSLLQLMPIGTRISRMVQRRQDAIQAKCDACEEEQMAQPKSLGIQLAGDGGAVSPDIEQKISSNRGGGQGMDAQTKSAMESSFGADFSGVNIHTGSTAVQMSQELNAHAFTVGSDIFFNEGRYRPQTREGAGLLAHELTHTIQQGAAVQSKKINRRSLSKMLSKHSMAHLSKMNTDTLSRKELAQMQENIPEEELMQQKEIFESKEVDEVQKKDSRLSIRRCSSSSHISHRTRYSAPNGAANTRKKVGVGEEVVFTSKTAGDWTATAGTPLSKAGANNYVWTAPNRATTAKISFTDGTNNESVDFKVIEPSGITGTNKTEMAFPAGRQGAGMKFNFVYHPNTVSFGNVEAKEVSHAASNISGYYLHHGMPHWHDTGDTFFPIGRDNIDTATDEASQQGFPSPWSKGGFDWRIPNRFKVKTEGGDGKLFTHVMQSFRMADDTSGKTTITKAGLKVERTP